MAYKLTHGAMIVRIADSAFIPDDPANADYAAFLAWQADGNTPEPADPLPAPEPRRIPKRVLVERLNATGRLTAAFTLLGGPGSAGYERWQASSYVNTEHPDVLTLLRAVTGNDTAAVTALLADPTAAEQAS
jgi:hypothetical protein